ncbi:MAG: energy-coupling factor ABC transporter ATP-binding protein [bacterium]
MKIELSHCSYRYGQHFSLGREYAIQDINVVIQPPQILGLIGPNGAGKSTLTYVLAGILKPSGGTVFVDGTDMYRSGPISSRFRKSLAFVPQFPESQFFTHSVYDELSFGLREQGLKEVEIRRRAVHVLRELELEAESILGEPPHGLSRGEKRLISIAIALVRQPKVLILDEPAAGLDAESSQRLWKILSDWPQRSDTSVTLVSDDLEELAPLVSHLVLMHEGLIVEQGSPQEVLAKPQVLSEIGLRIPQMIALSYELKKEGVRLRDWPIPDVSEAEVAIREWLGR